MRLIFVAVSFLFILPSAVMCQERIVKNMAGPNGDTYRSMVTFMAAGDDSYKLQTLIIDTNRVKNKTDAPSSFYVDLTSTVRSLTTGNKVQKILVMKWSGADAVEVKCENSKWAKQATGPELDTIMAAVKDVVRAAPQDKKEAADFSLPKDLEKRISDLLDSFPTTKLNCIRDGK